VAPRRQGSAKRTRPANHLGAEAGNQQDRLRILRAEAVIFDDDLVHSELSHALPISVGLPLFGEAKGFSDGVGAYVFGPGDGMLLEAELIAGEQSARRFFKAGQIASHR